LISFLNDHPATMLLRDGPERAAHEFTHTFNTIRIGGFSPLRKRWANRCTNFAARHPSQEKMGRYGELCRQTLREVRTCRIRAALQNFIHLKSIS